MVGEMVTLFSSEPVLVVPDLNGSVRRKSRSSEPLPITGSNGNPWIVMALPTPTSGSEQEENKPNNWSCVFAC